MYKYQVYHLSPVISETEWDGKQQILVSAAAAHSIHGPNGDRAIKSVALAIALDKLGLMTLTGGDNSGDTVDGFIGS